MLVVYASKTGNISRFIEKTGLRNIIRIETGMERVLEPFVLVTYTTRAGELPEEVEHFLKNNNALMKGVAGSGNKSWGSNFCKAVDLITREYSVPEFLKFELSGHPIDVETFVEKLKGAK